MVKVASAPLLGGGHQGRPRGLPVVALALLSALALLACASVYVSSSSRSELISRSNKPHKNSPAALRAPCIL